MSNSYPKELLIFCRLLGVFPMLNVSGRADTQRFSKMVFLYSLMLVSSQASLCVYSLFWDQERYRSIYPAHLQTSTAQMVRVCHICSVTVTAAVCVVSSGSNCRQLAQLYKDLDRVDDTLSTRCRSQVLTWLWLSVASLTVLYVLEYNVQSMVSPMSAVYLSVYSVQYIALAVHLQYVSVVDGIRRRLQLVNNRISEEVNRRRFLKFSNLPPVERVHLPELQKVVATLPVDIHCLSDLHWSLCSAIHCTNSLFSWQLLAHVVTLLLHTIIAPYTLFIAMSMYTQGYLTQRHLGYLTMQVVWVLTHWVQLLLLVWPCSAATHEANRTAPIVCKLLNKEMSADTRKQLETLVLQLFHHNAEFSVFGLFTLHCPLLTSIAGAVTTYLVILIQFQNADSNESNETPNS